MKKYVLILCGVVLAVCGVGAAPMETGLVARIHFAGGAAVAADPNAAGVANDWASPEALALRQQTLTKLTRSLDAWLYQSAVPTLAGPLQLSPLLADLGQSEWQLDLRQPTTDTTEFSLAVRLDNNRDQAWLNTLTPVVEAWKMTSPRHHARITNVGGWLLLTMGDSPAPVSAAIEPSLQNVWLTADINWGRLGVWYPELRAYDLPYTRLQVTGRSGNFEISGKLFLAQPLPPLEAWQYPSGTIHTPNVSFTAVRGISSWLKQQPWIASMGLGTLPDQLFTWAMPQVPFQTFAALPLDSAPAALPVLDRSLNTWLHDGPPNSPFQRLNLIETNNHVSVVGIPMMAPYFEAKRDPAGEYLVAGFFPNTPWGKPASTQLLAWESQPGLVYYHWENTADRLKISPQLYQLLFVFSRHRQLNISSSAGQWLNHLGPTLGTTVTEAFETAPKEVTFTRTAPAGLTAMELVAFASWLEAPNFPGCDLRLPPPKNFNRPGQPRPGGGPPVMFPAGPSSFTPTR